MLKETMITKVENIINLLDIAKELPTNPVVQIYSIRSHKKACKLMEKIQEANCEKVIHTNSSNYAYALIDLFCELNQTLKFISFHHPEIQNLEITHNGFIYKPYELLQDALNTTTQLFTPVNENGDKSK